MTQHEIHPVQIPGMARLMPLTPELYAHYADTPTTQEPAMTDTDTATCITCTVTEDGAACFGCGTVQPAAADPTPYTSYADKRTQVYAEADALRARGSKLARKLLALQIAHMDAQGPKAQAVAIARLDGACVALAALHGFTEHAWLMAVVAPWQADWQRPVVSHGLGGNLEYLRWEARMAEAIDAELARLL